MVGNGCVLYHVDSLGAVSRMSITSPSTDGRRHGRAYAASAVPCREPSHGAQSPHVVLLSLRSFAPGNSLHLQMHLPTAKKKKRGAGGELTLVYNF